MQPMNERQGRRSRAAAGADPFVPMQPAAEQPFQNTEPGGRTLPPVHGAQPPVKHHEAAEFHVGRYFPGKGESVIRVTDDSVTVEETCDLPVLAHRRSVQRMRLDRVTAVTASRRKGGSLPVLLLALLIILTGLFTGSEPLITMVCVVLGLVMILLTMCRNTVTFVISGDGASIRTVIRNVPSGFYAGADCEKAVEELAEAIAGRQHRHMPMPPMTPPKGAYPQNGSYGAPQQNGYFAGRQG